MRTWIIGILVFVGWSVGCSYWYMCQIKGLCPENWSISGAVSNSFTPTTAPAQNGSATLDSVDQKQTTQSPQQSPNSDPETIPSSLAQPFTILFAFAGPTADVKAALDAYLPELTGYLKKYPNCKAKLTGYTDDTAAKENNLKLSQRRCDAIADMLKREGISENQIISEPLGEANPVASNDTPEGRRLNRRVVISIQDLP